MGKTTYEISAKIPYTFTSEQDEQIRAALSQRGEELGKRCMDLALALDIPPSFLSRRAKELKVSYPERGRGSLPSINTDGYAHISVYNQYGTGRRMLEHIWWAGAHGLLQPGQVIHHINYRKDDNNLTNLFPCTPQIHAALNISLLSKIDELMSSGILIFTGLEYDVMDWADLEKLAARKDGIQHFKRAMSAREAELEAQLREEGV